MLRRWWLGAVVAAASIATGALAASAQQPPSPGTPSPTVPTATVPPVTVPTVTVPPVTVTPGVTTPAATTPPAQTPSVTAPSASTSSAASPSAATSGGGGAGGSGQASGAGQQSSGAEPSASATPTSSGAVSEVGQRSSRAATPRNLRRHDRALRRAVLAHQGCLGQMPSSEGRVLMLRAGVGLAHTRSPAEVARLTGLHRTRVVAIEHRALDRLRRLVRVGGCSGAASADPARLDPTGLGPTALPQIADSRTDPRISVLGDRESSASATPAPPPADRSPDAGRPLLHAPDSAIDLAPVLLFVALAGLIFAVVREARRSA